MPARPKVGSFNIGGAQGRRDGEGPIPFSYSQVSPGVYRVQPDLELTDGEYGFLYSSSTGGGPGLAGAGRADRADLRLLGR